MDAGERTLDWLRREQLQVDPEWSVETDRGFRWWADRHAQAVEVVGEEEGPDGETGYLVSVRTDFLRGVDLEGEKTLVGINALHAPFASMAGIVPFAGEGKLGLCSLVRVHGGIWKWMAKLISTAAVLQIAEARRLAPKLAEAIGGEPDESGHPANGFREEPDELARVDESLIMPLGTQPCRWPEEEFDEAVGGYMQGPPALLANGGGQGLTVEFPYGDYSSLCRFLGDEPHPHYGAGLFLRQSFPVGDLRDSDGARLSLELNAAELAEEPSGYGFGSYCYKRGEFHFVTFIPNAAYAPGLLPNLYYAAANRAEAMSRGFMDTGWEDMWDAEGNCRAKSSVERMMDMFGGQLPKFD